MTDTMLPFEPALLPELPLMRLGNRPTVLVAERNRTSRRMLATLLRHEGYAVLEAATAAEMSDAVGRQRVDLLLADDCFASPSQAFTRACASHMSIRVIADDGRDRQVSGLLATRAAVLEKPFSGRDLVESVRELLPPLPTA